MIAGRDIIAATSSSRRSPEANGAGYASFTFSVRDTGVPPGPLFDAVPNTMTVNVTPVNDLPVITSDGGGATAAFVVAENTTAVTTATATDIDLQPLTFSLAGVDAALFSIDSVTGVLTFNAAPNFEAPGDAGGDNVYNVTVVVSDGAGGIDTQALTITVTDANDAPTAGDDAYVTDEDLPLSIAAAGVLANDGDEDGTPITAVLVAGPANGSVAFNADGSFVYTPNANFFGVDTFTYQATDGALGSATRDGHHHRQPDQRRAVGRRRQRHHRRGVRLLGRRLQLLRRRRRSARPDHDHRAPGRGAAPLRRPRGDAEPGGHRRASSPPGVSPTSRRRPAARPPRASASA